MSRNALISNIDGTGETSGAPYMGKSTIAHLGIAPGVVETMIARAVLDVPGVAGVGGPKVAKRKFNSTLTKEAGLVGVEIAADEGHLLLDIRIQIYYGYRLQDIVDGIRTNVSDALSTQAGIQIDAINIYVSALQFEE